MKINKLAQSFAWILLSLPAVANSRTPTNQSQKLVSLDAPGWPLRRICASISKQIGQQVEPHGSCVTDVLIVHVHNVPWPVLMKKLAWVEYGKWYRDGSTLTLERDKAQITAKQQENADLLAKRLVDQFKKEDAVNDLPFDATALAREIKLAVDDYVRKHKVPNETTVEESEQGAESVIFELRNKMPLVVGFDEILESLPLKRLAELQVGHRIVFSNHPTSLQYSIPDKATKILSNLIANTTAFRDALIADGMQSLLKMPYLGLGDLRPSDVFEISVKKFRSDDIDATFRIFGPLGSLITGDEKLFRLGDEDQQGVPLINNVPTANLSPANVRNYRVLINPSEEVASPQLRHMLRHPEKYDPLAVMLDPILKATEPGKNMIINDDLLIGALVSDVTFCPAAKIPKNVLSDRYFKSVSEQQSTATWLICRPDHVFRYFHQGTPQAIPRAAYRDLIHGIARNGMMNFMSAMRFVSSFGPNGYFLSPAIDRYLEVLTYNTNSLEQFAPFRQSWLVFDLAGSLDASKLAQAETPKGLNLAQLPSKPANVLKAILFDKFSYNRDGWVTTIQGEPTNAFATSMPAARLTITSKKETVYTYNFQYPNVPEKFTVAIPLDMLASSIEIAKYHPKMHPRITRLRLEPQLTITLKVTIWGRKFPIGIATFVTRGFTKKVYPTWHDFPSREKSEIESDLKKLALPARHQ